MKTNKQLVYFYLPKGAVFDATEHYCNLIKKAFEFERGFVVEVHSDLSKLQREDYLVTIRLFDGFKLPVKPKRHFHWFQGIAPEEKVLLAGGTLRSKIGSFRTQFFERLLLSKVDLCFFVSERMKLHFQKKYLLNLNKKSIIIPCYNLGISQNVFSDSIRYGAPSFVYAGSIFKWQCIDETLQVFKEIQNKISSATLTILTKDNQKVLKLIDQYKINNVKVSYVQLNELQEELSRHKYGFLLRKDDVINNVSTPTKMNSYLSAGLIPIYNDCIDSFEKNIDLDQFSLKFNEIDPDAIAQKIFQFENIKINTKSLQEIYFRIFDNYYADDKYLELINKKLKELSYA